MKIIPRIFSVLAYLVLLTACGPTVAEINTIPVEVEEVLSESDGAYVILTLANTLDVTLGQQLENAGIVLFDPLGENRFQAYLPATAVSSLTALLANRTITGVALIDPATKIKGEFPDPAVPYEVIVHFYAAPTAAETAVLASFMAVEKIAEGVMNFAEGQATGAQIREIATLSFVKGIEATVVSTGGNGM